MMVCVCVLESVEMPLGKLPRLAQAKPLHCGGGVDQLPLTVHVVDSDPEIINPVLQL